MVAAVDEVRANAKRDALRTAAGPATKLLQTTPPFLDLARELRESNWPNIDLAALRKPR